MTICIDCKIEKPIADFRKYGNRMRLSRLSKRCWECRAVMTKSRKDTAAAGLKRCGVCRKTKGVSEFSPTSDKHLSHRCKQCAASEQDRRRRKAGRKRVRRPDEIGTPETGFVCTLCRIQKPATEFKRRRGSHWNYRCRPCEAQRQRERLAQPHLKFKHAKTLAVKRKLEWSLTFDEFQLIIDNPCCYCGHPLPKSACGIDRKDSRLGYLPSNCVPCCTECNIAKGPFFSYEEMLVIGQAIASVKDSRLTDGIPESSRGWGGASHRR